MQFTVSRASCDDFLLQALTGGRFFGIEVGFKVEGLGFSGLPEFIILGS